MKTFLFALLGVLFSLLSSHASATTIHYEVIDLPDTTPGDDLWQYQYEVSGHIFNENDGFSIVFDLADFAYLEDPPPPPNGDWDVLSLQPDPLLPHDGLYDGLALVDAASLTDRFTISFIWLGVGQPGSQPFEIYALAADDDITILETGYTIPLQASVPEPGMWALLGAGALGLAATRRRRGARPG